jgi:hypothetical protein
MGYKQSGPGGVATPTPALTINREGTPTMATEDITATTPSLEPRVATLEQIARDTLRVLDRIDRRMDSLEQRQHTDFLWLVGIQLTGFAAAITAFSAGWWKLNDLAVAVAKLTH